MESFKPQPKTIEDVKQNREHITTLEQKNEEVLAKLRETKSSAHQMGVNEFEADGHTRTDTFREIVAPIEKELASIGKEIGDVRTENNMELSRKEILEKREKRLNEIERSLRKEFEKTESGQKLYKMIAERENVQDTIKKNGDNDEKLREQSSALTQQIQNFRFNDKVARENFETVSRIREMETKIYNELKSIQG